MKNKEYSDTKITYKQLHDVHQGVDMLIRAVRKLVEIASDEMDKSNPDNEYDEYLCGRYIELDGALECLTNGNNYIVEEMKNYE